MDGENTRKKAQIYAESEMPDVKITLLDGSVIKYLQLSGSHVKVCYVYVPRSLALYYIHYTLIQDPFDCVLFFRGILYE